jgi:hypothetical protein
MGLGRYVVEAIESEGRSPTELARQHGISRSYSAPEDRGPAPTRWAPGTQLRYCGQCRRTATDRR